MSTSNQPQASFNDATVRKMGRGSDDYRIPPTSAWAGAWRTAAGIGVVGLAASIFGYSANPSRFAFSYMFAFLVFLTIALGSIFFVIIERLTGAGWSVSVRRIAELLGAAIPVFALLFLPILMTRTTLFPWMQPEGATTHESAEHSSLDLITPAYAQPTPPLPHGIHPGDPMPQDHRMHRPGGPIMPGADRANMQGPERPGVAAAHDDPEHLIHIHALKEKAPYLNLPFFLARAVFYFLVWSWLGMRFLGLSTDQDATKDPKFTVAAQRFAPGATLLFALTVTFAAFDWIMSLEPSWFSTIFGVCIFASCVVAMYSTLIILTMALRSDGLLKNSVTTEHYHDMGKLLFGFLIFWAYVNFSQFMLIWYAALPEEVTWFHNRWDVGPWKTVSLLLVFMHFIVPFFAILSRNVKRKLGMLRLGATVLLLMHVVEMYWLVMPNYNHGDVSMHWLDLTCLMGVGGVYFAVVFYRMSKYPLIPIGDPRLSRALAFENA